MKLSKSALLAALDDAEKNVNAEIAQYEADLAVHVARHRETWISDALPAWNELATLIRARVKAKKPITEAEVKAIFTEVREPFHGRYDAYAFWDDPKQSYFSVQGREHRGAVKLNPKVPALRRFLETVTDDVVSSSALDQIGFRNLEWLFNKAVGQ